MLTKPTPITSPSLPVVLESPKAVVPPVPPLPPWPTRPPGLIFLCLEECTTEVIKEVLKRDVSLEGLSKDPHDVLLFRKGWIPPLTARSVVLALDNHGMDTERNSQISHLVSCLLEGKLEVKIALPRREKVTEKQSFADLFKMSKGASRCAKSLRGAITIEHEKELHPPSEPLQAILQRLAEERDRVALGVAKKESVSQRVAAAVGIYEKGITVEKDSIVAVNLWLRSITYVPPNFRAAMLSHPDYSEEDNHTIMTSEDKCRELSLSCLQEEKSLKDRVILYNDQYWKVTSDVRYGTSAFLGLYNPQGRIRLNAVLGGVEGAFLCDFKQYTRLIPFCDAKGVLTGIERTFLGSNAQQERRGALKTKLARGVTSGSSAILYASALEPKRKVLGEGSENVLSALEVLRRTGQSLGLDETQFCAALGVSDVVKVPIEETVREILLIMDNDGYNMETKQTMIDTVGYFLSRDLKVHVVFAPSLEPGKKRDLNDVLREEGLEAATKLVLNPIPITSKEQLGPPNELLQFHLAIADLKNRLAGSRKKLELLLELGRIYTLLSRYDEALDCYYQVPSIVIDELRREASSTAEHLQDLAIRLYDGMALVWLKKNDPDRALELYARALKRKLLPSALQGIGRCYLAKGDTSLAASYLMKCHEERPAEESILIDMGNLEAKRGNYAKAIAYLKKVSSNETLESIGDIHNVQQNYDQAIIYYKRAQASLNKLFCSERHEKDLDICMKLADLHLAKGLYKTSISYMRKIFQKEPSLSRVLQLLLRREPIIGEPPLLPSSERQVVMDLEMTGDACDKDRIIDIGCVVLRNFERTGEIFHSYVNPKTPVRPQAHKLTGLTLSFLSDFPPFEDIATDFLRFIEGADLVLHAASSDIRFLIKELKRIGIEYDFREKHRIIDTLEIARSLYPQEKNNLDALNERLGINRARPKHRALLDAEITADVYIALREHHESASMPRS